MRLSPTLPAALAAALLAACASGPGGPSNPPDNSRFPGGPGGPGGPRGSFGAPSFNTNVPAARADMRDANGRSVGTVTFTQGAYGVVVSAQLTGLPPGTHAMHIHEVGRCDPPSFTSAGGHYNPAFRQHGVENRSGFHAGDLPNFTAPASGTVRVDAITQAISLGGPNTLFTPAGTALMIHSDADDYKSDPGGNAGVRIACGVIVRDSSVTGGARR